MLQRIKYVTNKMLWISIITIVFMLISISVTSEETLENFGDGNIEKIIIFPENGGLNNSANFSIENGANITSATMDISGGLANNSIYPYNLSFEINETLWRFDGIGYGAMGYQSVFWNNESDYILEFNDTEVPTTKWAGDLILPNGIIESAFLDISNILPQKFDDGIKIESTATDEMTSVALGDMDNDGDSDLIGVSSDENIYIFNNSDRDGNFELQNVIILNQDGINSVVVGDLDLDGDLDIACGNDDGIIYYFLMNGDSYDMNSIDSQNFGSSILSVDFGYLNDDNYLDIASGCQDSNFYYAMNNGDGTFGQDSTQIQNSGTNSAMNFVDIGDVDNDGDNDIVGANDDGDFYLARNNNQVFSSNSYTGGPPGMKSVFLSDVNFDSYIDLIGGNENGNFFLSINNGDGTYPAAISINGGLSSMNSILTFDIDLDGDFDIIGANDDNNIYISKNYGDGTFSNVPHVVLGSDDSLQDIFMGDVDIDGDLDIVAGASNFDFYIYTNNYSSKYNFNLNLKDDEIMNKQTSEHPFLNAFSIIGANNPMWDVTIGDVNNDGWFDIIGANEDRYFYLSRNNGDGTFGDSEQIISQTSAQAMYCLAIGDVNDDGWLDIVGGNLDGDFYISINDGNGGFSPTSTIEEGTDNSAMYSLVLNDLDNDGDLDIIAANHDGMFYIANNTGSGTFDDAVSITTYSSRMHGIAVSDLNKDGQLDLIGSNIDGNFVISLNNGVWFNESMNISINNEEIWDLDIGDFNNDGIDDLLGANDDGNFYIVVNDDMDFTEIIQIDTSVDKMKTTKFIDINNDGNLDIFGGNDNNDFYYSKNLGDKNFDEVINIDGGTSTMFSISSGDVDNDGNIDVVGANWDGDFYLSMNTWGNFQETTNDFKTQLQDYIDSTTPEIDDWGNEICKIPFNITSDFPGIVILDNINITYNYTIHLPDFSESLNNFTQTHDPDQGDNITIPLNFTSQTTGGLWLGNVNIKYIPAPDLIIESLEFLDDITYEGKNSTIEAVIKNNGSAEVNDIGVIFYLDDTSNEIANHTISQLLEDEDELISIEWESSGMLGDHEIIVEVDYENLIDEVNEDNNTRVLQTRDWQIVSYSNYTEESILLTGNLFIAENGKLNFENVTFSMNCSFNGEYFIEVMDGGEFMIMDTDDNPSTTFDASLINSDNANNFMFYVRDRGVLLMKNSELNDCGFNDMNKGLTIESDDVIIESNVIEGNYVGIFLNGSNARINNNEISNNDDYGIYLEMSDGIINNNTISNNVNDGIFADSDSSRIIFNQIDNNQNGIFLLFSQNEIQGNSINANVNGIIFDNSIVNAINNQIFGNTNFGINCTTSTGLIYGTTINGNTNDEVQLYDCIDIILDYCDIFDTSGNGIYFVMSEGFVTNSTIDTNIGADFYLSQDSHPFAVNTTFNDNQVTFEDTLSNLSVGWYLNVRVVHGDNSPISGVNVKVEDNNTVEIISDYTKGDGWVKWIKCIEYIEDQTTIQTFTPHNISATYKDETLNATANMTENREVILNLTEIELIIKSLGILNYVMLDGSPTTIEAVIANTGNKNVSNINLSFWYKKDDTEFLIEELTILDELGKDDEKYLSIEWDATGMLGNYQIILKLDPEDSINETNEENNTKMISTVDWKIVDDMEYIGNDELENIVLSGNLTIKGSLKFEKIRLGIWCESGKDGQYSIIVEEDGIFDIQKSEITAWYKPSGYKFIVNGEFSSIESTIEYMWGDSNIGGLQIFSDDVFIHKSFLNDSNIATYISDSIPIFSYTTLDNSSDYKVSLNNGAKPIFINTSIEEDKVNFVDSESVINKGWYVDIITVDQDIEIVPFADVKITDQNNVFSEYATDENGFLFMVPVVQLSYDDQWKITQITPHNISAKNMTHEGYVNIEINRTMTGFEDMIFVIMLLGNQVPDAVITANKTFSIPDENIQFYGDESNDPDGNNGNMQFMYDFGDGNITNWSFEPNIIYNYNLTEISKHEYTVKLYVKDELGLVSSDELIISLNNPPVAEIDTDKTRVIVGDEIQFDASDSYDLDEIDNDLTYKWDFDDEYVGSGKIVTHAFSKEGDYQVTLTVSDSIQEITETILIKAVKNNKPVAKLSHNLGSSKTKKLEDGKATVKFDASGSTDTDLDILKYKWNFGDGVITDWLDDAIIEHIYNEIGDFKVILNVDDGREITNTSTIIHIVTFGVTLTTDTPDITVKGGEIASFFIIIENTGSYNQQDKFNISIIQDDINIGYLVDEYGNLTEFLEIILDGQKSGNFTLNASIPLNSADGRSDIKLRAISNNDDTIDATLSVSVVIKSGTVVYDIDVTSSLKSKEGEAGKPLTYTFKVTNKGTDNAQITISSKEEPDKWSITYSTSSFILTPQQSKDVTLTANIPKDANPDSYKIVVKIISGAGASSDTTDEITFTVTVKETDTSGGGITKDDEFPIILVSVPIVAIIFVVIIVIVKKGKEDDEEEDEEEDDDFDFEEVEVEEKEKTKNKKKAKKEKKEKAKREKKKKPPVIADKKEKVKKESKSKKKSISLKDDEDNNSKKDDEKKDKKKTFDTIINCPKCDKKIEVPSNRPVTIQCPECNKKSTLKD